MSIGATDAEIVASIMGRKILKVCSCCKANGDSNLNASIHVPLEGTKVRSKEYAVVLCKDYSIHYVSDVRKMTREYLDASEMIMS